MLGEFFTCRDEEIDRDLLNTGPHGRFPTVEANGLTPVTLARLGVLLDAGSYAELLTQAVADHRESEVGTSGVFGAPAGVCANLQQAEPDVIAARWAATDELRRSGWSVEAAARVLRELRRLAEDAQTPIWYWWSI